MWLPYWSLPTLSALIPNSFFLIILLSARAFTKWMTIVVTTLTLIWRHVFYPLLVSSMIVLSLSLFLVFGFVKQLTMLNKKRTKSSTYFLFCHLVLMFSRCHSFFYMLFILLSPNFHQTSNKLSTNLCQTSNKLSPNFQQTFTKLLPNF